MRVLSGCYARFLRDDPNMDVCVFEKAHASREILEQHYAALGYNRTEDGELLLFYANNSRELSEQVRKNIVNLGRLSNHNEIVRFYPDRIVAFMQGRYLNYGEPDYKNTVNMARLKQHYLPEIKTLVLIAHES